MKKIIKGFCIFISVALIFSVISNVFALGEGFNPDTFNSTINNNGTVDSKIQTPIIRVVNTIALVLEVLGVGGVVFLGVKYMLAGSSDKAEIKQTLIYAVIGVIFVFAASAVVNFFTGIGSEIIS